MTFASLDEADLAYAHGQDRHARHDPGPLAQGPTRQGAKARRAQAGPAIVIETTVGRVIFNDILPDGMAFYNCR